MTYEQVRDNFVQDLAENAYLTMSTAEEMELAISAIEKQIPKKVNISISGTTGWNTKCHCPNCRSYISRGKYCNECGQALNWSGTE